VHSLTVANLMTPRGPGEENRVAAFPLGGEFE
jgi:hypothetical protein